MPSERIARQIRREPSTRAKVAIADIDGVLRGKYLSRDKFQALT